MSVSKETKILPFMVNTQPLFGYIFLIRNMFTKNFKIMQVWFFDGNDESNPIGRYHLTDSWEFKPGQIIKTFWGYNSTVIRVELGMWMNTDHTTEITQHVYLQREKLPL